MPTIWLEVQLGKLDKGSESAVAFDIEIQCIM